MTEDNKEEGEQCVVSMKREEEAEDKHHRHHHQENINDGDVERNNLSM